MIDEKSKLQLQIELIRKGDEGPNWSSQRLNHHENSEMKSSENIHRNIPKDMKS